MSYHVGAKEQYQSQSMFTRIRVCLLLALISAPGLSGADFAMKVTDKNYLDTQGFSVFLYDSTYHPVFVDQKNTAMEMILHGQRIATNGDVRLSSDTASARSRRASASFLPTGDFQTLELEGLRITPVITGEEELTQTFARRLFEEGVFCPAIVYRSTSMSENS